MAENCAVYNHASAFGVYALLLRGREEEGMRYLHRLLPFEKDPLKTRAEPYVLVNFYNGGFYPEKAGEGGIPWLTSTVSWVAMILFDLVLPRGIPLEVTSPS
jgi:cellobiose phosphorylase